MKLTMNTERIGSMKNVLAFLVLAVLGGCENITNYYGYNSDGGAADAMPILSPDNVPVLGGEELNIGNTQDIPSLNFSEDSSGIVTATDEQGPGVPKLVLMSGGSSQLGRMITISVGARFAGKAQPANRTGPIIGTLEFGSGGVLHDVDFDIPEGGLEFDVVNDIVTPIRGGVVLSFPASAFKLFARNDGAAFAIDVNGDEVGNFTWGGEPGLSNNIATLMRVDAFAAYSTRASIGPVRLTVPFARDTAGIAVSPRTYHIPAYAKRLIIRRDPVATPVTVTFSARSQTLIYDVFTIPGGVNSPSLEIPQQADVVTIDTGAATVKSMYGDFEIQL